MLPTRLQKASATRSCLRFANDYRGWCARRGIPPTSRLAKVWRLVVGELWILRHLYAADTRTGRRVRRLVLITAPLAATLGLRPEERRSLRAAGARLLVTRGENGCPRPVSGRDLHPVMVSEVVPTGDRTFRVRPAGPLTEEVLWARLRRVLFTAGERKALRSVIMGVVALQGKPVDVCRWCGKRWLTRRGRMLDCHICRGREEKWTRSRNPASRRHGKVTLPASVPPPAPAPPGVRPLSLQEEWSRILKRERSAELAEDMPALIQTANRKQEDARRRRESKAQEAYRSVTRSIRHTEVRT